jgi:predicted transcriptional regulator
MARAVQIMRAQHVSCLAVVSGGVLMGLLTEDEILQAVDSFLHEDLSLAA